jgi:hypothetical protein
VSSARGAVAHAGGLWGRVLTPFRRVEAEAEHVHEIEQEGESGATPFIAVLGIFLFLLPIFLVILGLAYAAYYLF